MTMNPLSLDICMGGDTHSPEGTVLSAIKNVGLKNSNYEVVKYFTTVSFGSTYKLAKLFSVLNILNVLSCFFCVIFYWYKKINLKTLN